MVDSGAYLWACLQYIDLNREAFFVQDLSWSDIHFIERVYRYQGCVTAAGGHGPNLLPKLHAGFFSFPKFLPVVCAECGYVRYYASKEARNKLEGSEHWKRL